MNDARTQHQLEASLDHLLARVTTLRVLRLRPEEQTCLVQAIERTRMQLLGSPEPVLVVVLADGTGVGKSALINALAGAPIAVVGDTRPTTTTLHVYHHYEVAAGALPTELASVASFVSHDRPQLRTKVLIDTPDLDSFATQHRTITRQVLKAAGLVLYVFSPEKYLDERTWSVLREEQHFSASAAVLNKTDRVSLEHRSSIFLCSDSMVDQCLLSTQQGGSAMRPPLWQPPVELSTADHAIIKRIRRAKLFVFLRQHRHTLFADPLQQELATLQKDQPQGHPPVPPAPLALATLLQAYTQVSDDEVIEATTMDRRWPLVLDCLDCDTPPFSTGILVALRQRLIAQHMDRRLLEQTVEIAAARGAFGARQWRAALDRSPLWGAGRVEDTQNLLGHALRKAVGVSARQQGRGLPEVAAAAGAALVAGPSLKAALDLDWDDATAQQQALTMILDALHAVEHWLDTQPVQDETPSRAVASLAVAQPVCAQDLTTTPDGTSTMRHGVAEDRRLSIADAEMRHGRKSRSLLVDGYQRHVLRDLDSPRIVTVGITPANVPEANGTDAIATDLAAQQCTPQAWHIDRASLASTLVQQRSDALAIFCQAWPVRSGLSFPKTAFQLD